MSGFWGGLRALCLRIACRRKKPPEFARCGNNVCIAADLTATYPDRVYLGDDIYIGPGAFLSSQGGLTIENGVIIGPFFTVYTNNHRYEKAEALPYDGVTLLKPVMIRQNVWIGGNVVIVPGVTVGEGAVVGAGSVVVGDVPELAIVGGNPARTLKSRDRDDYERLKRDGRIYMRMKSEGRMVPSEDPPYRA